MIHIVAAVLYRIAVEALLLFFVLVGMFSYRSVPVEEETGW